MNFISTPTFEATRWPEQKSTKRRLKFVLYTDEKQRLMIQDPQIIPTGGTVESSPTFRRPRMSSSQCDTRGSGCGRSALKEHSCQGGIPGSSQIDRAAGGFIAAEIGVHPPQRGKNFNQTFAPGRKVARYRCRRFPFESMDRLFNQFVRIMEPAALDLRVHTLHQLRLMDFKVLRLTESRESMYS